ncbi:MAG: hypothetical protein ACFFCW_13570 [Candidatus Hodarchaeota archaeon]
MLDNLRARLFPKPDDEYHILSSVFSILAVLCILILINLPPNPTPQSAYHTETEAFLCNLASWILLLSVVVALFNFGKLRGWRQAKQLYQPED